jgi:Xaa-Pro aminopeptidase
VEDPMGRFIDPTSDEELQRRWAAAREMMREKKIDFLVMQNQEEFMGGSLRWFTDWTARHQFPMSVIFALDEDMTVINTGNEVPLPQAFPPRWGARGVKNNWGDVYFPTHSFSKHYDARLAVDALKTKPKATIGWVEPTFIPMTFASYLQENLPDATFVDATEEIDILRARKSAEEIRLSKVTAKIQDDCFEHLKTVVRPGMHDYDVYAEVHYYMSKHGSGRGLVLVNSGPMGSFAPFDVYHLQGRVIQEGDQLSVLNETNGPGGLYTELCRIFCVGCEPDQELQDAWANAVELQHLLGARMVPGASCKELYTFARDFMVERGYAPPSRSFAHGQGYALVERPSIRLDEPWDLMEGMSIAVHPVVVKPGRVWTNCCDNFIVGDPNGAEKIHNYPQELVLV